MTQEYISKDKLKELTVELDHLKNVRRNEIARALEYAKSLGDLSENAEYHQAREDQAWAEDRIIQIEHILRTAKVIDSKKKSSSVAVGSTVIIQKEGERDKREIQVVGGEESDVSLGKFSFHSPFGSALLGKSAGEDAVVVTPKGETKYKIVEVK
jgi:transcription elongation factor GreA